MSLKEKIQSDMKNALKKGDRGKLNAVRFLLSQIKNAEIEKRSELSDDEIMGVISREIKKIKEAAEEFREGGNPERAEKELREAEFLSGYLPEPFSEEELENLIEDTIREVGASTLKDISLVMKELMPKVRGRAEGLRVSEMVKKKLEG